MKHIEENIIENIYTSPLVDYYFHNMSIATMDIETTGLSATRNKFILGGLYDAKSATLHQYFADNRTEEATILDEYMNHLSQFDVIITFNGKHFDVPFLEKRYEHIHGEKYPGHMPYNLDLYLLLNGHSPIKRFVPNLKQKTVEDYMGLWDKRSDKISGSDSIDLYSEYEKKQSPELAMKVLLHNSDDVMQLARLTKVLSKCDIHKGLYKIGFPAGNLTVNNIKIKRDVLIFSGIQRGIMNDYPSGDKFSNNVIDYTCYELDNYPATISFRRYDRSFEITVPIIRDQGLVVIDLLPTGVDLTAFDNHPTYTDGFLAIESPDGINYLAINHFIKIFMERVHKFIREEL